MAGMDAAQQTPLPVGYRVLANHDISHQLAQRPDIAAALGGTPAQWHVRDVADGNLNSVFLVEGPNGGVCVKQSLPWVRVAKDDWPLSVERAFFESAYMQRTEPFALGLAPRLLHFDASLRMIVMERLRPHTILRQALIAGVQHPLAARAVAEFAASTLFHTSDIANPFERKADDVALFCKNHALQRITVDLVFIDPYTHNTRNRYVSPHLNAWARALREDGALKSAVARHRNNYLSKPQALLHGDLHSGSVMVTQDDTRVIDGEFAWVGPIGFDTGNFIGNLLLSWFAKASHRTDAQKRDAYRDWIAQQVQDFWQHFHDRFLAHWQGWRGPSDGYPASHFDPDADTTELRALKAEYLEDVWADTLAFAAIEMVRRCIGFAQVADFSSIQDPALRARVQAPALALARDMLVNPHHYRTVQTLLRSLTRHDLLRPDSTLPHQDELSHA